MLIIPEEIKALFRSDNNKPETRKKFKLTFYDTSIDTLYPYETLFPEESLFPAEGTEPWLVIENDRIVTESLQITEALSSDEDLVFGSCEGAELQITVADVTQDITNREFTLTVEIGGYEMALGIYTVKSFVRQSDRRKRKITAYDRMSWFNVNVADWYNNLSFPLTLKSFRDSLCNYIGIQQDTGSSLLFDNLQITKTIEPEQISGADVLSAICEINGCFGHIDKTGQLKYIQLQQTGLYPSETLYPENDLYPSEFGGDGMPTETVSTYKQPMTYEDYLVDGIDSLVIRQEEGDVGANVGEGNNTYAIEGNFLVYGKSAQELLSIAQSLLPYISGRVYRPASLNCNCMPWLEVGDAIIVPTKDDIVETFVMKRTISGCQAMRDKIESTGSQTREEQFTIQRQITQLEGKSAVIVKTVEEVSATVTDLAEETEAQFAITAGQIQAEVIARQDGDNQLSSTMTQTATEIRSEVSDTAAELQSQITLNANQILLKVSKGEVSSQLSVETGQVTISSNRLVVNSTNFKLDANGNATFSGAITGGTINVANGKFQVDASGNVNLKGANLDGCLNTGTMGADVIHCNNLDVSGPITCDGGISTTFVYAPSGDSSFGEIYLQDSFWDGWSVTAEVELLHDTVFYGSDKTIKKDIRDLSGLALDFVLKSRPVSFRYIKNDEESIGFIAQEVIEIQNQIGSNYPLVSKDRHTSKYRIEYNRYIPILVSAIQNLQKQLNELKDSIYENNNI